MRQQCHRDFPDFTMNFNASEKPTSTIVALCDGTQLHFFGGPEKRLVTVDINAGDCCFFAGDVLHAGAGWEGPQPNFRLFMYWPTADVFVPWTAQSAAESLKEKVAGFRVSDIQNCYNRLKFKTNPLSESFSLSEYNSYLYDFEEHSFYRYDDVLYLQGIGANIDGYKGKVLEARYDTMQVPQIKKLNDCPHFVNMPFIDNCHLVKCRKRCFYCMRHLRHNKVASAQVRATPTPRCQHDSPSKAVKKGFAKIRRFMPKIQQQMDIIQKIME